MTYDPTYELKQFGRWRSQRVLELAGEGEPDRIHGSLIIALGSRESNLRPVVGGGFFADPNDPKSWVTTGVDRGFLQINADYHAAWLKSVKGCLSGEWAEAFSVEQGGAYPKGRVPGLTSSTKKAIAMLRYNLSIAERNGIDEPDLLPVAVAGYNSGISTAVNAFKKYGDADKYTTKGDYSKDVLERQKVIRKWLKDRGWTGPSKPL